MARTRLRSAIYLASLVWLSATHAIDKPHYANAIASAHPLATQAGMTVLRSGGNAFDAAITVASVLSVVEPYSSGMGGGGFWLLHRERDGKQIMVDGREKAPLAARQDLYLDADNQVIPGTSINGALATAIPGQVAALVHLQKNYATRPLATLLRPAINIARLGFKIDKTYLRLAQLRRPALQASPKASSIFLNDGKPLALGDVIKQADLADTLQAIAQQGKAGFYSGPIAKRLVDGVRAAGGIWSMDDLAQYQVVERQPIRWQWQGLSIITASLPSSGGIVLAQIFNILSHHRYLQLPLISRQHLLIEAMRRAYRDRAKYLGDSDFVKVNWRELTSLAHSLQMSQNIRLDQATPSRLLPIAEINKMNEAKNTTHYSILDQAGNRVSATLSINYPFGSGFVPEKTGVLLNNEMDDFAIQPGVANLYGLIGGQANAIAPGKRMLSSMSPSFIESEDFIALVGTPGGSRIITMVAQAIIALQAGLNAEQTVAQKRIHHQYLPDRVQLEPGALSRQQMMALSQLGHELELLDRPFGNMQIVVYDRNKQQTTAASDPRAIGLSMVD